MMKSRAGFVSNSSSSSFVVAFSEVPETVEEMQELLFAGEKGLESPWKEWETNRPELYPAEIVAKTVFEDLERARSVGTEEFDMSEGDIIEELNKYMYFSDDDLPDCWALAKKFANGNTTNKEFDQRFKECIEEKHIPLIREKVAKMLFDAGPLSTVVMFTYGDEYGHYGAVLEHGGLFKRLPHITISNH